MSSSAILLGLLILMATFAIGFLIGRSSSSWPGATGRAVVWRVLKPTLVVSGLFLLAIQLIPYGRAHANPPVLAEPAWDSPATRDLAVRRVFRLSFQRDRLALVLEYRSDVVVGPAGRRWRTEQGKLVGVGQASWG